MFEREHHRRIASILEALDADLLAANACWFGGGTAIVLAHGEYRESVDIDLMVADAAGYRVLRQRLGADGMRAIAREGASFTKTREVRADQYGIRTLLAVNDAVIKFEIVREGNISYEVPGPSDRICGVARLTTLDMATTKLLANADRWADDSTHSRDLVDLAMLTLDRELLRKAIAKASGAYGASVERELGRAVEALRTRDGRLEECMRALKMMDAPTALDAVPPALLWKRIRRLAPRRRPTRPPRT